MRWNVELSVEDYTYMLNPKLLMHHNRKVICEADIKDMEV